MGYLTVKKMKVLLNAMSVDNTGGLISVLGDDNLHMFEDWDFLCISQHVITRDGTDGLLTSKLPSDDNLVDPLGCPPRNGHH